MTDKTPNFDPLSSEAMSDVAAREVREHKGSFWFLGALSIIVGTAAIILPYTATLATEFAVAAVLVVSGLFGAVTAFRFRRLTRIAGMFLVGLLALAAGVLLFVFPLEGILALTMFLAAYFIASGLVRSYLAFKIRPARAWGWVLAGALASIALGVLMTFGLPEIAAWVLGLLVGIDMIVYGVGLLMVVMAAGSNERQSADQANDYKEKDGAHARS